MDDAQDLYRRVDVRAIERAASASGGLPEGELMERAGTAAWQALRQRWPACTKIGVACGPGNNGGDGYVLARLARDAGLSVELVALAPPARPDAVRAAEAWHRAGGTTHAWDGRLPAAMLWVDAVFGIGLSRAPEGDAAALIAALDRSGREVLALDVPSGVDVDRGAAPGVAVAAAMTVEFLVAKQGLATGQGLERSGERRLCDLGVAPALLAGHPPSARRLGPAALATWLLPRRRASHKGEHGHVLCIGGDHGMGGAVLLAAAAALRCGAGRVSVATRPEHVAAVLGARPELMVHAVRGPAALRPLLQRADVIALGPGLGQSGWGRSLWRAALGRGVPTVLDADALNLLATTTRRLPGDAILTPHPGEAARLLGVDVAAVEADRFAAVDALVSRFGCPVVLKGAGSLVAAPDACTVVIDAGNPGMASAGMGDVLTGVVAAMRAVHPAAVAAVAGALLHAAAGDLAAADAPRGLCARDLMPALRRLANPAVPAR